MHHSDWLHHLLVWMHDAQDAGWSGWLWFIILYALSCLLFLPGSILTLGAGTIYGFWIGVLLVQIGNGLGAMLSLLITRYLLRDWAQRYVEKHPKLEDLKTAVEREGWRMICLTHLSPVMPFSLINYALGLTRISAWEFLIATEIGSLPSSCLYVYFGTMFGSLATLGSEIRHPGPLEWTARGVGLVIAIGVTIYISRLATQALKRRQTS